MKRRSIPARVALASVALALLLAGPAPAPAAAAGGGFGANTVAHTYNFTFTGQGESNTFAVLGWFEVDASGNVTAGAARGSLSTSGLPISRPMTLDTAADNRMVVSDPTNGIYELRLRFLSPVIAPTQVNWSVLLDDPRGRSGKASGEYTFDTTEMGGVGLGDIASQ